MPSLLRFKNEAYSWRESRQYNPSKSNSHQPTFFNELLSKASNNNTKRLPLLKVLPPPINPCPFVFWLQMFPSTPFNPIYSSTSHHSTFYVLAPTIHFFFSFCTWAAVIGVVIIAASLPAAPSPKPPAPYGPVGPVCPVTQGAVGGLIS